jgi:hypothetical protein
MIVLYGTVVEEDGVSPGQIMIDDGRIVSMKRIADIEGAPAATPYISGLVKPPMDLMCYGDWDHSSPLTSYLIFPGFVDIRVKSPESLAALSGGITTCRYNIVGNTRIVSTIESLRDIQQAQKDGEKVYSQVHPINLYFDTSMITPENERSLRSNPPICSPEDRKALLAEFVAGNIDIISSSHTQRDLREDTLGVPELDTFGPMMIWLIDQGVPPEIIFKTACLNPAELFPNLKVGRIKEGYAGDITVLAFKKPMIDSRQLYTSCGWSPYDLRNFAGSVEMVICDGQKVVDDQWMKS